MDVSADLNSGANEKKVLEGLRRGDHKTFEIVFKDYYPRLCNYANGLLHSFDSAEEIVQEVFINFWNNHGKIEIYTSLKPYLYRSVYYGCLNYLRKNKKIIHSVQLNNESNPKTELLFLATSTTPFTLLVSEEFEKELGRAIEDLPDQCRKVFCLSRFENLSYAEIAEKLGLTVSTVKTHMSRAMTKLVENVDKNH